MSFSFKSHNLQFLNHHRDSKSKSDDGHGGYESDGSGGAPDSTADARQVLPTSTVLRADKRRSRSELSTSSPPIPATGAFAGASGER